MNRPVSDKATFRSSDSDEIVSREPISRILVTRSWKCNWTREKRRCWRIFRRLPPDTAAELSALAERLAALSPYRRIDWSDSWTDEDMQEFRAASLRRLEAEEPEEPH